MSLLRDAIINSGITQAQLAVKADVSKGVLSRLMRGERAITLETAERIADALGYEIRMDVKLVKRRA